MKSINRKTVEENLISECIVEASLELECFDSLYEKVILRNSEMVYRLAYSLVRTRADADDIYQEVFLRYMQKDPIFESVEHEKAWFLRVTINCSKNFWKSPWLQRRVAMDMEDMDETVAKNTELMYGEGEETSILIDIVKQLSRKYRVVIHLFYYEELSVEEIAKITKAKASTVRTRLTRARRQLKNLLNKNQEWIGERL
ncbi:MAG: RNA polymerase sigma factor [Lachnospiraceae bacterium]|jgi:RNA polymerase sigma-70 factor (ECF subfamily)|nr:RNA polymerase sigma factor [Lachnospiraceae bacterium]